MIGVDWIGFDGVGELLGVLVVDVDARRRGRLSLLVVHEAVRRAYGQRSVCV